MAPVSDFEALEHASRENLVDKNMPWPQTHGDIARWVMAMTIPVEIRLGGPAEEVDPIPNANPMNRVIKYLFWPNECEPGQRKHDLKHRAGWAIIALFWIAFWVLAAFTGGLLAMLIIHVLLGLVLFAFWLINS